jgi:riboflavin kinase/FMN adenylyltransferase
MHGHSLQLPLQLNVIRLILLYFATLPMQVHRNIDNLPAFRKPVLTIGTFDGVHKGHRQILNQLQEVASASGGETVIITFHPHPRTVVGTTLPKIHLINTIEERIELLTPLIDHLVIVPFTEIFSRMTASEYVEHFLVEKFHPETVIIGYDHRFGEGRKGDYQLLESFRDQGLFKLIEIPPHILDHNAVSSTRIRDAITKGDVEAAAHLLGYDFFFSGKVVNGNKLGRKLGYPTANLDIQNHEKLIPGDGVYAVLATLLDSVTPMQGMMNIGMRPTIGNSARVTEVNLFNFDREIYGETMRVFVKKRLRDEVKFPGINEMVKQMGVDKENALKILNS